MSSCRAPFQPEEKYQSLRRPTSGPGPTGANSSISTHSIGLPLEQQQSSLYNEYSTVGFVGSPFQSAVGYSLPQHAPAVTEISNPFGPSKLSASATEFVPNQSVNMNKAILQQQYQQVSATSPYVQQQQHYMNGYKHQQHLQHQQHFNQQQHQYNTDIHLSHSVQNRLVIGKQHQSQSSGMGNYYQQQQQQQVQTLPQHHPQLQQQQHSQTKFQRHAHLNNSFHQIQQQQQQHFFHNQQNKPQTQPSTSAAAAASAASTSSASSHPDMETIALEYLDTVIHCLNQNPGQFDSIASRFLTIFDGMENNNYVLSIAMEDIFEKSIEQPNFRYMGAKLYNLLHMLNLKPDSLFHTLLKCKLDYHQAEVTKYMQSKEQQQKVRETALFLAELYMQLRGDDDSRIQLIAVNIVYSLGQLLEHENAENVRCICQTLKLAGYDLSTDCPQDMKVIISSLQTIEAQSAGRYPMAANVIALQQNNWGRKVSNALGGDGDEDAATKPPEPPRLSDEPVFYGPDGRELTAEESDFLAEGGATGSDGDDYDDVRDGDLDLDPEMDEETERAYKDFCKQKKQQQNKKS